jgi:hypothetical protein
MTFIIWFNFFFVIIGIGFIMGGICLSQQKVKRTAFTSSTAASQTSTEVQQTPQPVPAQPAPTPVAQPEEHRFCPHCGNPAEGEFCATCGAKID